MWLEFKEELFQSITWRVLPKWNLSKNLTIVFEIWVMDKQISKTWKYWEHSTWSPSRLKIITNIHKSVIRLEYSKSEYTKTYESKIKVFHISKETKSCTSEIIFKIWIILQPVYFRRFRLVKFRGLWACYIPLTV